MNYYQEKVETDSIIPARIYIGKSKVDNFHYPLHWHNNLEFDLVLDGMIKGKINGKQIEVCVGEFLFVNSGELHETDANDRNQMSSITILLSYNLLKEYCHDIDLYYFDFVENKDAQNKVKNLILECADLYEKNEEFYELGISIVLRKICCILLKECKKKKQNIGYSRYEQKSLINTKKAISYMEKNYVYDISLKNIADEIGMSPTYFSRFFKKTTGETFYCYLNKIRLYYAHKELMNSDESITEIALNNGFSNVKAFIEVFKKIYKVTPAKYKNQLK
ncbi:HTH-type transcriptional regulator ChbR [Clostridium puniceum]|uniref:HTH-type transcriptional regulator ChbR n=1 Tax=Clostridium puniceum TaxID=29367 RepID=A0A1S8TBG9_9CLOT|nr:helix-turn-helix domain-containing protein [Clostridium puniceum]OOM75076.1 HTH-type transcriptional regulator ChbR [Clostridium puniceum]